MEPSDTADGAGSTHHSIVHRLAKTSLGSYHTEVMCSVEDTDGPDVDLIDLVLVSQPQRRSI